MAVTYWVTLRHPSQGLGCESEETHPLHEFGYTDEEWDTLSLEVQSHLIEAWAEEGLWSG